ncbi:1-(5-phosphoribosyl)-5-[(5-phosphoribosylamino)methylideneamino]imidazole-4-carboxamide isomerase [Lysobacter sp. SG-8]|uniref:1-(5-phosphoribosyl)-5-[(5-phosphoribosylamino)methylideneamino] imidazole-4-carboxamide isomerase n=1 Tax=Marilutibacter penaei TaxID=2759900 RepID=A0A7W3YF43_9GAMM|nr:1-(5-phosphoribosyl)-5-[(5-phosphoribosylamino)methylideneamino]imidazole-4-carboxamide isomerase [Lysobacter penaei]MBB1088935.1 1-(5-phosphoribosyl)-5-[(5-phosphoribosylamino)methylideneamino]imidazole-4-carboxamide isomerase [Lysobacter penaei]
MTAYRLYPAIDVRGGRVVRLHQGDYERETRYPIDPLEAARRYADAGAEWLHLVDLDAARNGGYTLGALLESIKGCTHLKVQTGGGVRAMDDVDRILACGADRVVVGSLAVKSPDAVAAWLARRGASSLTVALDTRQDAEGCWRLPVAGWTEDAGYDLDALLQHYMEAGARHLLCTDIARDGTLRGPNLALYRHVLAVAPSLRLQASGGIRGIEDIHAAHDVGCAGAVLGKALLEGRFDLVEALGAYAPC